MNLLASAEKKLAVLRGVDEYELLVRDATNPNESWGPTGPQMNDLAEATFKYANRFNIIKSIVSRYTVSDPKNWRQAYKALLLTEYLVKNGCDSAISEFQSSVSSIKPLTSFKYVENGKDHGLSVRERANKVIALLNDDAAIMDARAKAETTRGKFTAIANEAGETSTVGSKYSGFSSSDYSSVQKSLVSKPTESRSNGNSNRNGYDAPITRTASQPTVSSTVTQSAAAAPVAVVRVAPPPRSNAPAHTPAPQPAVTPQPQAQKQQQASSPSQSLDSFFDEPAQPAPSSSRVLDDDLFSTPQAAPSPVQSSPTNTSNWAIFPPTNPATPQQSAPARTNTAVVDDDLFSFPQQAPVAQSKPQPRNDDADIFGEFQSPTVAPAASTNAPASATGTSSIMEKMLNNFSMAGTTANMSTKQFVPAAPQQPVRSTGMSLNELKQVNAQQQTSLF